MKKKIEIVIPCYNEQGNIAAVLKHIDKYYQGLNYSFAICFVDDGSTDETYNAILDVMKIRDNVKAIRLSRNFGKEAAITVALNQCRADAAIIMDADLQHPPSLIPQLIHEWEKGAEIVDAVKITRQKECLFRKMMGVLFNKIMSSLTNIDFFGASDYKLLDRKAIAIYNRIAEKNRLFRGLTSWMGLQHSSVGFTPEERTSGKSKWSYISLLRLSLDAVASYTSKPLHLVTVLGGVTLGISILLGLQTLYSKIHGNAASGFTTVIIVILVMASINMISLGILGFYLSKIYNEVKNRPIYIAYETRTSYQNADEEQENIIY